MPTSAEQIIEIEAALRQRFFAFVPRVDKPNRTQWNEEQHDTDRLSRSLAAYALVGLADIEDAVAASAVTDGDDDGGIDALYFDRSNNRLFFVQSKFKRNGAGPSQAENLKTINGIKALISRRFSEFNDQFQGRVDEIEEALDTPGVVVEVVLIFLGDNLSPHVTNDLDALKAELNTISELLKWDWHGLIKIYGWLIDEQTPTSVTADVTLENWATVASPRKAIYGQISASSLAELVNSHGKALFERNIRHYLGSVDVNTAISKTVLVRPGEFFYLNNGLTAVADTITPAAGTQARCNFRLTRLSIVNGAQTAGAIAIASQISPDAKVLFTVIEIGDLTDDFGIEITRARNYQNEVRGVYFAALDPNQERIRRDLALLGITYHYRPSAEARTRREDAFILEDAALALSCLSFRLYTSQEVYQQLSQGQHVKNAVTFAVTAKKEIGRLWDQTGDIYPSLFGDSLSGVRVCRIVQIYRFLDRILAGSELSEWNNVSRRMFFRHGRYFIMACVAHRLREVINKPEHLLSEDDKTLLSRTINELGELIYAESAAERSYKGYLSIFRNLTDAQPLANRVVARLAARDAATMNSTATTNIEETGTTP